MLSLVDYASSSDDDNEVKKETIKSIEISSNNTKHQTQNTVNTEIPENEDEIVGEANRPLRNDKIDDENPNMIVFKSSKSEKKEDPFAKFSLFGEEKPSFTLGKRSSNQLDDSNGPSKKKTTIKIPINIKKTEEEIEEQDEDLKPLRSIRPLNDSSSSTLSFLPAPKNKSGDIKSGLPPLPDDFFGDDDENSVNPTLKQRTGKNQKSLKTANVLNKVFGEDEDEPLFNQDREEYDEQPSYPAYEEYPQYKSTPGTLPQGINTSNMVKISAYDLRGAKPSQSAVDTTFIPEALKADDSAEAWAPTKSHRRQNHASFLIWDLKNKLPELEAKRAESARNRKEARNRYGW